MFHSVLCLILIFRLKYSIDKIDCHIFLLFLVATSGAIKSPKFGLVNREFDDNQGDEILDDQEEEMVRTAQVSSIPSKLKAVIKFGYEDGLNSTLAGGDFDSWITDVFTHTQAHFRHAASLGTAVEFEVCGVNNR